MAKEEVKVKKKPVARTEYKVGDYIACETSVFLEILGVINDGLGNMYCLTNNKGTGVQWMSQYELDDQKFELGVPNFDRYSKIKAGDILRLGNKDNSSYITILARVGDAVLLSSVPDKEAFTKIKALEKAFKHIASEIGEGGDEEFNLMDDETEKRLKRRASQLHSSKIASEWMSIKALTLMNWVWVTEEE